jgi:hypothetical protein
MALSCRGPPGLYARAVTFARVNQLPTVYDSLYVVLAQDLGADLWTADRRLLRQIAAVAPWVRWLGDYPLPTDPTAWPARSNLARSPSPRVLPIRLRQPPLQEHQHRRLLRRQRVERVRELAIHSR